VILFLFCCLLSEDMKSVCVAALVLVAICGLVNGDVVQGKCGKDVKWVLDQGSLTISGDGPMDNFTETTSHPGWWNLRATFQKLFIQGNVSAIGKYSFWGCTGLNYVLVQAENLTFIGEKAFANSADNDMVTEIILPGRVEYIESGAFENRKALKKVTLPDTVTFLGDLAFSHCEGLTEVNIPTSLPSIQSNTFSYCKSLESVTIPDSVQSIGDSAFYECDSLKAVTIPNGVPKIGSRTFNGCESLTTVSIPDSVTVIGDEAFMSCSVLTGLTLPSGLTTIGNRAFSLCKAITELTIPETVKTLGKGAFNGCESLAKVDYPTQVKTIPDECFMKCKSLPNFTIQEGTTAIGSSSFKECVLFPSITIPGTVATIGNDAFSGCTALTSVFYKGASSIENSLFKDCSALKDVCVMHGYAASTFGGAAVTSDHEVCVNFRENGALSVHGSAVKMIVTFFVAI